MFVYHWNVPVAKKTWTPQKSEGMIPGKMLLGWQGGMKSSA